MVDLLDGFFDIFGSAVVSAWPSGRGVGSHIRSRARRPAGDTSWTTRAAALAVLLVCVPPTIFFVSFTRLALEFLNDDLLFFLGLILVVPLAMVGLAVMIFTITVAISTALGLVVASVNARLAAVAFAVCGVVIGWSMVNLGQGLLGGLEIAVSVLLALLLVLPSSRADFRDEEPPTLGAFQGV